MPRCRVSRDFYEIKHFHYIANKTTLLEIYNFCRHFLCLHYYTLSLSDLCLRVEKILKEITHFHFMTYLAVIQHKNPCLRGHETNNLCRPFLNRQYDVRRLSDLDVCSGVERKILKIHKFYTFLPFGWVP